MPPKCKIIMVLSNHAFSNIAIVILDFSLLLLVKLLLLIFFAIISLLFLFISLSIVIALPSILIAIVVTFSCSLFFAIFFKSKKERQLLLSDSLKSDDYAENNTEKKPYANLQTWYKIFDILGAPIIFMQTRKAVLRKYLLMKIFWRREKYSRRKYYWYHQNTK